MTGGLVSDSDAVSYRSDGAVCLRGVLDKVWIRLIEKVSK